MSQPQSIKIVRLQRLAVAYPPEGHFVAETQEIFDKWEHEMSKNPLGDPRCNGGKPYPSHLLDKSKLQYEVGPDENIVFMDADTDEVTGFAFHGLLNDPALLKVLNGTVVDHLNKVKKTLRDNDPGYLVGVGYTSGSRGARALAWTNNLKKEVSATEKRQHAYKMSALFAHIWSHAKRAMPKEILDDFENATMELGGLRMDGGVRGQGDGVLRYTIVVDGEERHFETSDLSPPAALCGINYGRHIHNENNHNKYCLKYITCRTHSQEYGAGFFNAEYGIYIPSLEDQLAGWRGKDLHGTGYAKNDPYDQDPPFKQIGVAFILAYGIKSELEKEKKLGITNMPETFDPANGLVTSTVLNDAHIEPRRRPSMIKRKVKEVQTVYSRMLKETFVVPATHAYSDRIWTHKTLEAECAKRQRAGTLDFYAKTWSVEKLKATLLINDGVDVKVTRALPGSEDKVQEEDG